VSWLGWLPQIPPGLGLVARLTQQLTLCDLGLEPLFRAAHQVLREVERFCFGINMIKLKFLAAATFHADAAQALFGFPGAPMVSIEHVLPHPLAILIRVFVHVLSMPCSAS